MTPAPEKSYSIKADGQLNAVKHYIVPIYKSSGFLLGLLGICSPLALDAAGAANQTSITTIFFASAFIFTPSIILYGFFFSDYKGHIRYYLALADYGLIGLLAFQIALFTQNWVIGYALIMVSSTIQILITYPLIKKRQDDAKNGVKRQTNFFKIYFGNEALKNNE